MHCVFGSRHSAEGRVCRACRGRCADTERVHEVQTIGIPRGRRVSSWPRCFALDFGY